MSICVVTVELNLVIVAVHFAAVPKRYTVSTAIRHRRTVVFTFLLLLF